MKDSRNIVDIISSAVRRTYDRPEGDIPLHAPSLSGLEWKYVKDCLDSGWVSYLGEYVDRLETMVCDFTGSGYAVATVNGTAALHMALLLVDVEPDDEVLCPAFTFAATVTAIVYCRARPVFMDSDADTLGMDVIKVSRFLAEKCTRGEDGFTYNRSSGRRVKACIPMHTYGYPVEMTPLMALCDDYNIALVEDAAEALGSYYGESHCGTIGKVGILSFNGNKIVTTGGGGMILTGERSLRDRARHLTTTAKVDHPWEFLHDDVGYNYRMPNINAALGCAQFERLPEFLGRKAMQADRFRKILENEPEARAVQPATGIGNHWFNLVRVDPELREEVLRGLNGRGIQARASWHPLCLMDPYTGCEQFEIETAQRLAESLICLPNGILDRGARGSDPL